MDEFFTHIVLGIQVTSVFHQCRYDVNMAQRSSNVQGRHLLLQSQCTIVISIIPSARLRLLLAKGTEVTDCGFSIRVCRAGHKSFEDP